jgi:hypothetical protein
MGDVRPNWGPDDSGYYFSADRTVAVGHRRLSILDLSRNGLQAMSDGSGPLLDLFITVRSTTSDNSGLNSLLGQAYRARLRELGGKVLGNAWPLTEGISSLRKL